MNAAEALARRVMVTRPAGQADTLIAALEEDGWQVDHLPLIAIEPLDLAGPARQRVQDLDLYAHLVFISANAARLGCERINDFWPQWPAQQRYWAVGESTARVLEGRGLAVERPERDMSSEGLLAMPGLQRVAGERVLIVRGEGGRGMIAETLRERGATVDDLCCYRRSPVAHDGERLVAKLSEFPVDAVLVSSGEGLELLTALLSPRDHADLASIRLLVPSPRVAQAAGEAGWQRVTTVVNASDDAMLEAVRDVLLRRGPAASS